MDVGDSLYMFGPGSGTIRKCSLVGVGVMVSVGFNALVLAAWKLVCSYLLQMKM